MGRMSRILYAGLYKIKRKQDRHSLWGPLEDVYQPDINRVYSPYTITKVNGCTSIAEFFKQQPLPILMQEQDESASNYSKENPPKYDIQKEFDNLLSNWNLVKQDEKKCITDDCWGTIVTLIKSSLSPRFIYAPTYPNSIYIVPSNPESEDASKNKNVLLGKYEPYAYLAEHKCRGYYKITLFANEIQDAAERYNCSFELMAAQVILHELGHYVMDDMSERNKIAEEKTAEESCANLIALLCLEQLAKNQNITEEEYNTIVHFMHDQPEEYRLGPELMKENSWEWLKWSIFKREYSGFIHQMETKDCIMSVDGEEMYFKSK